MKVKKFSWALFAVAALVGCSGRAPELADTASPFDSFLARDYDALAAAEFAENDWFDGRHFGRKANAARRGETPMPDALSERDLPPRMLADFEVALDRLEITLASTARLVEAETLAGAQATYDCWAQEAEEDLQAEEIAACREAFLANIAVVEKIATGEMVVLLPSEDESAISVTLDAVEVQLDDPYSAVATSEEALGEALDVDEAETLKVLSNALAAAPRPQRSYLIYFLGGGTEMAPESAETFQTAIADALETEAARVTVFGHTDRQGSAQVNTRLARARAETIRLLIIDARVSADIIAADSFGEDFPVVPTADGVAEPLNRRVEIAVR